MLIVEWRFEEVFVENCELCELRCLLELSLDVIFWVEIVVE